MTPTTFSYRNYLKPTPKNLQMAVEAIQGACMVSIGTSWANGADPHTLLAISIFSYALGKMAKFFGRVADDQEQVQVTGKDLIVTQDQKS